MPKTNMRLLPTYKYVDSNFTISEQENDHSVGLWMMPDSNYLLTSKSYTSPLYCEEEHNDTSDPWVLISTQFLSPIILRMSEYSDLGRYA